MSENQKISDNQESTTDEKVELANEEVTEDSKESEPATKEKAPDPEPVVCFVKLISGEFLMANTVVYQDVVKVVEPMVFNQLTKQFQPYDEFVLERTFIFLVAHVMYVKKAHEQAVQGYTSSIIQLIEHRRNLESKIVTPDQKIVIPK